MTSRSKRNSIALAVGLLLAAGTAAYSQKIALKLKLTPGQTFKIAMTSRHSGAASLKNQSYATTESFSTVLAFSVESVDTDGTARMKVTFADVSYSVSQPGAAQASDVMNKLFAGLNGQSFALEVASSGEVRSLTGTDAAGDAALKAIASYPEQLRTAAAAFLKQAVSDPMWKLAMASVFSLLPQQPVAVGERWSRSFSASAHGATEVSETFCKIIDRANGVAKVKVFTDVKSLEREPAPGMRLATKGTGEGTVEIEEATGLLVRGSMQTNLKGHVTGVPGQTTGIPIAATGTSTIRRY